MQSKLNQYLSLVFLAMLCIAVPGFAADPSTQSAVEPMKPPFAMSETATQAESATITLRSIETLLDHDRTTMGINEEEPILATEIDSRLDESAKLLASSPSLQLLGEQEQDWSAIERTLNEWKHELKQRSEQFRQVHVEVEDLKSIWRQEQVLGVDYWFKRADSADLQETAANSVADTRLLIDQTGQDVHDNWVDLLTIQQAVDGQAARVLEVLNSVRQARDEAFNRLLMRNNPPLWSAQQDAKDQGGLLARGRESLMRQVNAVAAYLKRRRDNVVGQIVLLLALIGILYFLRNRTQRWAEQDPELKQPTLVFGSPIATGIVLSLLLSAWIYPQAPRLFWAAIEASALIPTVIILRRLIERRWFSMLDALVVFYFLDQLRSIAAVVPIVARVLLLIEMAGAALLIASVIRSQHQLKLTSSVARVVQYASWFWLVIFVLALIGDVVGYTSLANLLGDAALGSSYLAVILYACAKILSGLLVIALHSRPLVMLRMVREHQQLFIRRLNFVVGWLAVFAWAASVLASLSVATAAVEMMRKILAAQFVLGGIHLSPGHILAFSIAIWASVQVSRFLRFVLEEDVYDRLHISGGISYAVSKMLNYLVLLAGFFFAVSALGYDMTNFTILASAFGVGLGFGMQNIVNNFVSGLILLFERPIKVGDVIQMDDTTGIVSHIGIRASIIRTLNSAEIIVPNGNLISGKVTNWTLSNRQRGIEITISVGATADPSQVMKLLSQVAASQPLIIKSPAPEVFLMTFSADAFSYQLHAWTNAADQWVQIRSDLSLAIHTALIEQKIPIR